MVWTGGEGNTPAMVPSISAPHHTPSTPASEPLRSPRLSSCMKLTRAAFEEELDVFKQAMIARLSSIGKVDEPDDVKPHATESRFASGFSQWERAQPDVAGEDTLAGVSLKPPSYKLELPENEPPGKAQRNSLLQAYLKSSSTEAPDMLAGALNLRAKEAKPVRKPFQWFNVAVTEETRYFKETHPFRGLVRICALHPLYDLFFGLVVLISVVLMGIEIEWVARDNKVDTTPFFLVQCICCILFIVEVTLRMLAFGRSFWGIGNGTHARNWKWNLFDSLCTITMVADICLEFSYHVAVDGSDDTRVNVAKGNQARMFRFFRLMRIVRAMRCVRVVQFARELRKMSYALQYSFHTLLWAMLLLVLVMFFFATAFTQATTEVLMTTKDNEVNYSELQKLYGTLPSSYFSLFQSITGGEDWVRLVKPLMNHTHWMNTLLFLTFTAITTFGVMNVITSVFVESALASAKHYKDLLIQESTKQKQVYIDHLRDVFAYIDFDNSGEISADEMDRLLHDEDLRLYLESIEIQPDDARTLFRLLDKDNSGQVNIDEFCKGCLKLKGDAKSYDIHCIIYENQRLLHKWQQFMNYLEKGFLPKILREQRLQITGAADGM